MGTGQIHWSTEHFECIHGAIARIARDAPGNRDAQVMASLPGLVSEIIDDIHNLLVSPPKSDTSLETLKKGKFHF